MADRKKVTGTPKIDGPSFEKGQETPSLEIPEFDLDAAIRWCEKTGEFTASDLAKSMGIHPAAVLAHIDSLVAAEVIELAEEDPEGRLLEDRYRARLTRDTDPGDPEILEPKPVQGPLYLAIALDETNGPKVPGGILDAFLQIGEIARAQRSELRARLQEELDAFVDSIERGDGHLGSFEANHEFVVALNSLLDELGLRLVDPKTGGPATLRVWMAPRGPETGYFAFCLVGTTTRGSYRTLPRLKLVDRPETLRRTRG